MVLSKVYEGVNNWDSITTDDLIDTVFCGLFKEDKKTLERRSMFFAKFICCDNLSAEYKVLYLLLKDKPTLAYDKEYLMAYLTIHRGYIANNLVDLSDYVDTDKEPYQAFTDSCIRIFENCCKEIVDEYDFYICLDKLAERSDINGYKKFLKAIIRGLLN